MKVSSGVRDLPGSAGSVTSGVSAYSLDSFLEEEIPNLVHNIFWPHFVLSLCVCVSVCACVWRPMINIECVPQMLFTFHFGDRFAIKS